MQFSTFAFVITTIISQEYQEYAFTDIENIAACLQFTSLFLVLHAAYKEQSKIGSESAWESEKLVIV